MTTEERLIAYTAVILKEPVDGKHYGLGLAEEDVGGYVPFEGPAYATYDEAAIAAKALNERIGLTPAIAASVVATSIAHPTGVRHPIRFHLAEQIEAGRERRERGGSYEQQRRGA